MKDKSEQISRSLQAMENWRLRIWNYPFTFNQKYLPCVTFLFSHQSLACPWDLEEYTKNIHLYALAAKRTKHMHQLKKLHRSFPHSRLVSSIFYHRHERQNIILTFLVLHFKQTEMDYSTAACHCYTLLYTLYIVPFAIFRLLMKCKCFSPSCSSMSNCFSGSQQGQSNVPFLSKGGNEAYTMIQRFLYWH